MFIHLGKDTVVQSQEVITILDCSRSGATECWQPLLDKHEQAGTMIWISKTNLKSIVITNKYIYGSPISSVTLTRKA